MMKLFLFAIPILFLLSCQHHAPELLPQAPLASLQGVKVKNGRLHFPNQAAYHETELAINSQEAIDLSSWHEQLGFCSMKKLHDQVQEDFAQVNNRASYNAFLRKHQDHLYITADSSISIQGYQPFFSQVLNTQGEVYIGNALVKYTNTHKIRIEDGSEEKLKTALSSLKTDEDAGRYVKKVPTRETLYNNARNCASRETWHTCFAGWWHRTVGYYYIHNNSGIISSGTIANNNPYDLTSTLRVHILTQHKGFLGFWYRERTTITWNIGWGASAADQSTSPIIAHGTGWTVSNVSEINYSKSIRSIANAVTVRLDQIERYSYNFDYCYANLATPLMSCSKSCP